MGAWRQCRLCPWRRTLHVYMLYTTYIVTTIIGQCKPLSVVGLTPVPSLTPSKSTNTTVSSTQEEQTKYTCKPSCNITDVQQKSCKNVKNCSGNVSCSDASNCSFQCRNKYFNTIVLLSMTEKAACEDDAGRQVNLMKCDPINGQTFQFEKQDSLKWSDFFSETQFGVTCYMYPVTTKCSTSGDSCCPDSLIWNCTIAIPTSSTTSTTTTSNTTSTSTIRTTTPTTSTTRPTKPTTSTKRPTKPTTSTTRPTKPTTSTTRPTKPTTSTKRPTKPTTSTTTTTMVNTSEKVTSTPKTSTTGSKRPRVLTSTAFTQTVTEGRSTASQTDSDQVPTIAALVSLLVLSIVVISILVIIVLRRNRRRKPAENPEFIINNTAYGDVTLHPKTHPGPDNPISSREVPAKPDADEEHTYCYASFDDSKQTVNTERQHPNVQDPINATTSPEGSYFVLDKGSQKHGDNYKMEQAIVMEHLVAQQTGHLKNKLDNPGNYFVLDKPNSIDDTKRQDPDESANYFVLETTSDELEPGVKRNHEEEITETGDTRSGNADDNYFLVDKSDGTTADDGETSNVSSNHSTIENQDHTSNDNYFVLDKITDDSKVVKHMETHCGNGLQNSDNTETCAKPRANGTPTTTADPYDHVRIGHAHTNGFDDGVYDELRKQNVRYEAEEVENDYDHC